MKTLIIIGLLAMFHPSALFSAEDPFAVPATDAVPAKELPRPERSISKLPTDVTHRKTDVGHHEYRISGIYSASAKKENPAEVASHYKIFVPECLGFDLDFKQHIATFSTSRELSLSDLAYAIDDLADLGGDIPYWVELEARDLAKSTQFPNLRFSVKAVEKAPPSGLAWFWVPKEFRIPLSIGGPDLGTLLIVPSTSFCMCHSRFSIRILDAEGKVIWKDEETAYAAVKIALSEANEYDMHKIWLTRNDHGKQSNFVIIGRYQKEKDIEPARASDGDKPSN